MATDFYLTLPSNASMKLHPDNTLAHYITDLPQRISMSGEWECGLAEIQYPHTWYNVREDDTWFYLNERIPVARTPCTKIEAGYYRSPDVLLDHVNKALKRMSTDKTRAKMSYSTITQKMTLHMSPGTDFSMPYQSAMGTILGFYPSLVTSPVRDRDIRVYTHPRVGEETNRAYPPELSLTPSAIVTLPPEKPKTIDSPYSFRQEATTAVNMNQGFDTIYVYTDVVESRIVGDSLVPLLRCLPVRGGHGVTVSDRFTNVHYVPLLRKEFGTTEVDIRDDTGRRVPFEYGRVTVTLHFRRRRTGLF